MKPWNYDSEHDLERVTESCEVLFRTAASLKLCILTYSL